MTLYVHIENRAYPLDTPANEAEVRELMRGRVDHLPIWESKHDADWLHDNGDDPEARPTGRPFYTNPPASHGEQT